MLCECLTDLGSSHAWPGTAPIGVLGYDEAGMAIAIWAGSLKHRKRGRTVDIFDLLQEDHERVCDLLRVIEISYEPGEREETFDEMKTELVLHSEAEENIFYRELASHEELRDLVMECREEHKLIEQLLEDMARMDSADEQWPAKLTVLSEIVAHHVREEEKSMFRKAREAFDTDVAVELAERFEEEKENLRGRFRVISSDAAKNPPGQPLS
ncbi:MAG: hemerythrin domain-containing protein [Burkholderiales bacterium]